VIAAVAAIAVAVVVAIALTASDDDSPTEDAAEAEAAAAACGHFRRFIELAENNGSAEEASDALDDLVAASDRALAEDPRWAQLASGAKALRLGFDEDDPDATRAGLGAIEANCSRGN
jgi:hypothetical protein